MRLRGMAVMAKLLTVVILLSIFCFAAPVMAGDSRIIGVWDNSDSKDGYKIVIAEEDEETVFVKKFNDGIKIRQVVITSQRSDGVVYKPEDEETDEYYVVDQTGNLQVWDVLGLQVTLEADK
jgi:hypothetical protein